MHMKYCENATLSENLIHDISSPEEYSLEVKFCSGSKIDRNCRFLHKH